MHKLLILLPNTNDRAEAAKLNENEYEVNFLHASADAASKDMATSDYASYLTDPNFLISYVDRAVDYVKENGITGILYGHDMSSVVASVVCERTGLRGPSLESTFRCLHKYYSRKTEKGKLWFDYIYLDDSAKNWKSTVRYPCFLKAPFLTSSKGHSCIRSEAEMEAALAKLDQLVAPYYMGYSTFFEKYLDLEKFPLAVENIAVVEELVQSVDQYCIEGWMDDDGQFTLYTVGYSTVCPTKPGMLLSWVIPQFSLDENSLSKLIKDTEQLGRRFGLYSTFYDVEVWKRGADITLIEINARMSSLLSEAYRKMWGASVYQAAIYLACGEVAKVMQTTSSASHEDGEPISGYFLVYTCDQGRGKDFIDFEYARVGSISDGVYNNAGPGMVIAVEEESIVKQTSSNGCILCHFLLDDYSSAQLFQRAEEIMGKVLLRSEDRDKHKLYHAVAAPDKINNNEILTCV